MDAEEKGRASAETEIEQIPVDPGVYMVVNGKINALKQAEVKTA